MSTLDKIKLLWIVLQKGQELGSKEFWKNLTSAIAALQAIFASLYVAFPEAWQAVFTSDVQTYLAYAAAGVGALVVYFTTATSKSVGV